MALGGLTNNIDGCELSGSVLISAIATRLFASVISKFLYFRLFFAPYCMFCRQSGRSENPPRIIRLLVQKVIVAIDWLDCFMWVNKWASRKVVVKHKKTKASAPQKPYSPKISMLYRHSKILVMPYKTQG